ncbi:PLP-dependent aminotransferase family protein [Dongia soli]|uniref:PLP-dependent aminotransferase family protein n=1 Tax=Dongia soli TaxID=600628 RepID=A0ABU5E9A3_9PROT|nr:PLP-dependent aminotransferase family protein [Dongia soli]MDY0882809.1 PLP-dependent aminotransferase family protein [Dongia soli]
MKFGQSQLDRHSQVPVYRQIYDRFRDAIARGQLGPGERLPSARSLASQLGTARGTVDVAYNMLAGEGYIIGRGAAGTIVAPCIAQHLQSVKKRPRTTPRTNEDRPSPRPEKARPFQMGLPALDVFPRKLWSRLAMRRARTLTEAMMVYPDPLGERTLRDQIACYLAIARGIQCSPQQIVITSGFQGGLALLKELLLQPGDAVWLEDPGYFMTRRAFEIIGANVIAVPVDENGLSVDAGIELNKHARIAVVTPSHQAPLGVSLSLPRRLALLDWAQQHDAWIIEDDYDGEFRYTSRPLPALKSLDQADRVIYAGTFSKVLFPALRVGYIVLPENLLDRCAEISLLLQSGRSLLNEQIIADFMAEGHFARHIRRMRQLYANRRAALAEVLNDRMGGRFRVDLSAGGLHLLAWPKRRESDRLLVSKATALGLAPGALSAYSIKQDCGSALLLSFTNIPVEAAPKAVSLLEQALAT